MTDPKNTIAFQGELGANSHMACQDVHPTMHALPCATFEDVFAAVKEGRARLAMLPVENSLHGRITDIHHLLPESGLFITGEHFLRIHHQFMAVKGAKLEGIKSVMSQIPALGQCRNIIRDMGLKMIIGADTAGSARHVAEKKDPTVAALASRLAAEIYGLDILKENVEDAPHNTTRFLIMSPEADDAELGSGDVITTFVFRVRNVPAALYKAMGGFATNGVNMTKLESYQIGGSFNATQFYAEVEGHPDEAPVQRALEELGFFSTQVRHLGVFEAHPYRQRGHAAG